MNNLTFDKILFADYTSGNAIFEHMQKKSCSEQLRTLPESNSRNNIILTILHDFSSEEVHFQESAEISKQCKLRSVYMH